MGCIRIKGDYSLIYRNFREPKEEIKRSTRPKSISY